MTLQFFRRNSDKGGLRPGTRLFVSLYKSDVVRYKTEQRTLPKWQQDLANEIAERQKILDASLTASSKIKG